MEKTIVENLKIHDKIWIFNKSNLEILESRVTGIEFVSYDKFRVTTKYPSRPAYSADFKIKSLHSTAISNTEVTLHLTIEDAQNERTYHKDRFRHQKTGEIRNSIKVMKKFLNAEELEDFKKSIIDVFGKN